MILVLIVASLGDARLFERYHAHPGKTVAILKPFRDEQGRSSYDLMAAVARGLPQNARVLDLACGDGYLLSLLAAQGFEHLIGVDCSPQELQAARARLGPHVELHQCNADVLPLAGASIDLVLCHMALMLMDPIDAVLEEIARVLRPGCPLVAVINRRHPDPVFDVYSRELVRVTTSAGLERLQVGPPAVFQKNGLRRLLGRSRFDEMKLQIHDFVVQLRAPPRGLWPVCEAMYDVFRLPAAAQGALEDALLHGWESLTDDSGQITASMGLRLVQCPTVFVERAS